MDRATELESLPSGVALHVSESLSSFLKNVITNGLSNNFSGRFQTKSCLETMLKHSSIKVL